MLILALSALCAQASPPFTLEGTWRFDVVVTTKAQVPVLGASTIETHKVMVARIDRQSDGSLMQSQSACGMFARSKRKTVAPIFPPGFLAAMPSQRSVVDFDLTSGRLKTEVDPVLLGWDSALAGGVMPRDADSPGVIDGDGDGAPGVTVQVQAPVFGTVSVYLVQHSVTWLDGAFEGPDAVRGRAGLTLLEQRTIGASNALFAVNVPLVPEDAGGWFSMRRVPDGTSCAQLDTLAPPEVGTPAGDKAPGVKAG